MTDILRGKRLEPMDDLALKITSSVETDKRIQKAVVYVNMAHVLALYNARAISKEDMSKIMKALSEELGGFPLDYRYEDVHMSLEQDLSLKIGEVAGHIGLAKSRNDQVATAIRLELKEELLSVMESLESLIENILNVASENVKTFFITFTHLQPAQASTGAHWLLSYAWALLRDLERLKLAYSITDMSPMGSAANAGSLVPVDRYEEADMLGFSGLVENTIDAVSTRDFIFDALYSITSISLNLSKLSADIISFMSLGILDLDDKFVSTSSIMPQKRNPVVAEIVRAKSAVLTSNLIGAMEIVRGLNSSYNLDLQEITPRLWASIDEVSSILKVMSGMVLGIKFNENKAEELAKKAFVIASDLAEFISLKFGVPFREAHHIVGEAVKSSEAGGELISSLIEILKQNGINADAQELTQVINPVSSIEKKITAGGPHPKESIRQINMINLKLKEFEDFVNLSKRKIEKTYQMMINKGWY
ncbi:MAG: argininosuccinate lyase [Nitrososphaeria archaeon]|nr:argininosuccinate lyase [Conexivisphaerales archaeon]